MRTSISPQANRREKVSTFVSPMREEIRVLSIRESFSIKEQQFRNDRLSRAGFAFEKADCDRQLRLARASRNGRRKKVLQGARLPIALLCGAVDCGPPLGWADGRSPPYKLRRPISGTNRPDFRMPVGRAFAFETMLAQIRRCRSLATRSHCKGAERASKSQFDGIDALFQACP